MQTLEAPTTDVLSSDVSANSSTGSPTESTAVLDAPRMAPLVRPASSPQASSRQASARPASSRTATAATSARQARQPGQIGGVQLLRPSLRPSIDPSPKSEAVDPRLADRRQQVRMDLADARSRPFLLLFVLAAAVVIGIAVLLSPFFSVRSVQISGVEPRFEQMIRSAGQIETGTPIIRVRAGAVRDRLSNLPWVGAVQVQKRWPSTVIVRIRQRKAIAVVETAAGARARVDKDGQILETGIGADTLPTVSVSGSKLVAGAQITGSTKSVLRMLGAQTPEIRRLVTSARLVDGSVELEVRAGSIPPLLVNLGSATDLAAKGTSLDLLVHDPELFRVRKGEPKAVAFAIDLRAPDSPVVAAISA